MSSSRLGSIRPAVRRGPARRRIRRFGAWFGAATRRSPPNMRRSALIASVLRVVLPFVVVAGLSVGAATRADAGGKVVLVIADHLRPSDVLDKPPPGIARLASEGGVGLVSRGPVGRQAAESAYATVSAGAYSWSNTDIDHAYSASEPLEDEPDPAATVFNRRTGSSARPAVVHLDLAAIEAANQERFYTTSHLGALAEAIGRAGKRVAVFGNSDLADTKRRGAAAIAAAGDGAVPMGDVSSGVLRREAFSPTGFVTSAARLASEVDAALERADFVVVDFGDTARVELSRKQLSEGAYEVHRRRAVDNLGDFISRILKGRAGEATIVLTSIAPPIRLHGDADRLAPMVLRRPGGGRGCVTSSTTRTPGLVSGFDIAPTVLAGLGVRMPRGMIGSPIAVVPERAGGVRWLSGLVALNGAALFVVLGLLAGIGILAATVAALAIALGWSRNRGFGGLLKALLAAPAAGPLAALFATVGEPAPGPYAFRLGAWWVALTVGTFAASKALRAALGKRIANLPGALPVVVMAAATTLVIFVDALRGGALVRYTVLSTGRFEGARFYGIGNEYMGAWLGLALVSMLWIRECFPGWEKRARSRAVLVLVCLAIIAALGFPQFGANAGGAVSAVVALGLVYWSGTRGRFGAGAVAVLAAAGAALVAAIAVFEVEFSRGSPSHIGLAASMSDSAGYNYLVATAVRKLAMNVSLIGTTQAEIALGASVPFFILWFWGVGRRVSKVARDRPGFLWGGYAVAAAAVVTALVNDSGVVAGFLVLGFYVLAILYTVVDEERGGRTASSFLTPGRSAVTCRE